MGSGSKLCRCTFRPEKCINCIQRFRPPNPISTAKSCDVLRNQIALDFSAAALVASTAESGNGAEFSGLCPEKTDRAIHDFKHVLKNPFRM